MPGNGAKALATEPLQVRAPSQPAPAWKAAARFFALAHQVHACGSVHTLSVCPAHLSTSMYLGSRL